MRTLAMAVAALGAACDGANTVSCADFADSEAEVLATTYTVLAGVVPVVGARVSVSAPNGELRDQAITADDGTAIVDVADGDVITVGQDSLGLQPPMQSVVGVDAGEPLTFYVSYVMGEYGLLTEMPELRVRAGGADGAAVASGPCLLTGATIAGEMKLYWQPECLAFAIASGFTEAPLIVQIQSSYKIVDIELGTTTPLDLTGDAWIEGTTETLTPSGEFASEAVGVYWTPIVGPADEWLLGSEGYHRLEPDFVSTEGTDPVRFDRAPVDSEAAMLRFGLPDAWYESYTRVPASAYGSPISVDNVRNLTGDSFVEYDPLCSTLAWSGSEAADFLDVRISSDEVDWWQIMLPRSGAFRLPEVAGASGIRSSASHWETDLTSPGAYLDLGEHSTRVRPPVPRQTRYVEVLGEGY